MHQTFVKPTPSPLRKTAKRKAVETNRREVKSAVFARDKGRCRCCRKLAHEMHELLPRSLGGKRSLENSVALCNYQGANCHRLIQTRVITAQPVDARLGANGQIAFERDGLSWLG